MCRGDDAVEAQLRQLAAEGRLTRAKMEQARAIGDELASPALDGEALLDRMREAVWPKKADRRGQPRGKGAGKKGKDSATAVDAGLLEAERQALQEERKEVARLREEVRVGKERLQRRRDACCGTAPRRSGRRRGKSRRWLRSRRSGGGWRSWLRRRSFG